MAIGDVYQVIDKQKYSGTDVVNVYFYRALATGITADIVAILFRDTVVSQVVLIQTTIMSHLSVEVINLNDPADFTELIYGASIDGVIVDSNMPSYVSWTFKLIRADRTVRNGRKAICGVAEGQTANNSPTGGAQAELDDTAAQFAAVLDNLQGLTLEPVIYGKPTPPPSSLPLRVVRITGAQFSHLSTQNTRKNFS